MAPDRPGQKDSHRYAGRSAANEVSPLRLVRSDATNVLVRAFHAGVWKGTKRKAAARKSGHLADRRLDGECHRLVEKYFIKHIYTKKPFFITGRTMIRHYRIIYSDSHHYWSNARDRCTSPDPSPARVVKNTGFP